MKYRCPKCGRTQEVFVPVVQVVCGKCPKRKPREVYPLMEEVR
jgi:protein-arginine kinase activator protein McsA